jgi:hypothetical protein
MRQPSDPRGLAANLPEPRFVLTEAARAYLRANSLPKKEG